MTSHFIKWLKDVKKKDISTVGGKGANLGEMFSRFPIPDGFCIIVSVFEIFLESARIKERIVSLVEKVDVNDLEKTEFLSKQIRNLIIKSIISPEMQNEVVKNYKKLNGFVAVRSSAVAEDLQEASFAGQQATFLNVKGEKDLLKYIKECWASFYTSRAIIYRDSNKFNHEPKMAIVIQEMIDAKKSGVIFTINPVTKNKNEMIIEAAFGLGESIVSGMVTPDNFLIDKNEHEVIKETINEKKIAIVRQNGKNKTIKLNTKKANEKTLNKKEINQLIKESLNIENHYKKPMDIEWAIDGKVYILQARPITTL
ncbi:hypothetical protein HYX06_05610 [Candidatus Woesearchaeota archaeon]|nr:hypothetical protein [Candidatus Woesearchaeota archaeon]